MIRDDTDNRKHKRKLENVAQNVYQFKYKHETYGIIKYYYGFSEEFLQFKFIDKYDYRHTWLTLKIDLEDLRDRFKEYEVTDTSIKSAPDTSKYLATVKGNLEVREDYSHTPGKHSLPDFYGMLFTVGNNAQLPTQFYNELFTILTGGLKNEELNISNRRPRFGIIDGTAWTGYGLKG